MNSQKLYDKITICWVYFVGGMLNCAWTFTHGSGAKKIFEGVHLFCHRSGFVEAISDLPEKQFSSHVIRKKLFVEWCAGWNISAYVN